MKKLILAAVVALAGWFSTQAQTLPAPEKYNDYLEQIVNGLDQPKAEYLMNATMETLSKDPKAYRQMMELAERRFSDPADPIHNEGLYMIVLKHASNKFVLSNAEKEKQRLLLEGAKKNMIGSVATDFDYVTPANNDVHHLKDLKSDYILVYFNNPDCESCEKVKERLATSELINQLANDKKLTVLAIYPYEDGKLWKKAEYPKMMINGWNKSRQIEQNELYDLPTLPCFYLMDKNYTVLVKNEGSLNKVEALLKKLTSPQETGPAPAPEKPVPAAIKDKTSIKPNADKPATDKPLLEKTAKPAPPVVTPAPADDPNTARSEQMMNYMINDQGQEIYDNLADMVKAQAKPEMFNGAIGKMEAQLGKSQGHEEWNIQQIQGFKAYTSLMNFEKGQLGMIIVYDAEGKIMGINMVPAQAISQKKN